jgi:hypothetical protein
MEVATVVREKGVVKLGSKVAVKTSMSKSGGWDAFEM